MIYIGIDPGLTGAIGAIQQGHSTPVLVGYRLANRVGGLDGYMSGGVDEVAMLGALRSLREELGSGSTLVLLEGQRAMRGQGVSSTFKTGAQFGIWRGLLACLGWPYVVVTPQAWRKHAGIVVPRKGDPKAATVRHVGRLLPDVDLVPSPRARNPHDGLADALGMALACRAMHKGGQL